MRIKSGFKSALWMVPGAVVMLLFVLVANHFQKEESPAQQDALKARRVDLTSRMQIGLSTASEAEKGAVMAVTDQDSKTFADQARAAAAQVERESRDLEKLIRTGGTQEETNLLEQFSRNFAEFQRIDKDLLDLAVKNTNLKAYSLAFGPATSILQEMNGALSRIAAANGDSPDARKVMPLAFGAQISGLRIQTLLAPHIAEESNEKMDKLEALMAREDEQIRKDLDGLKTLPGLRGSADLATAASAYARFSEIRTQILALSRENTNVLSLAISLNQKRRVTVLVQDSLNALKQAIMDEPVKGVKFGPPPRPR